LIPISKTIKNREAANPVEADLEGADEVMEIVDPAAADDVNSATKKLARLGKDLVTFETALGWFGVLSAGQTICRLRFGFESRADAVASFEPEERFSVSKQQPPWQRLFELYSEGNPVSFAEFLLETEWMSPFQKRVVDACCSIPYGSTRTYGQLATIAGSPGAARAVGSVMRSNRFPIIVPCHRVVGTGRLGGFSASGGVGTKRRLLEMENAIDAQGQQLLFSV
jgi:methylated-DNA-[protein]-cysteine S-methyltransferase